jgi:hypothetical protein
LRTSFRVEAIADANRQVREHRARFGTLDAFYADVADDEVLRARRQTVRSENGRCEATQRQMGAAP